MGTRGLIFIKRKNKIKLAQYCQFDMYYEGHGLKLCQKLLDIISDDNLYQHFIENVDELKFIDTTKIQQLIDDKYDMRQFNRETASFILDLIVEGITTVSDSTTDINSIWPEFAYMIDIDTNQFMVYSIYDGTELLSINDHEADRLKHVRSFNIDSGLVVNFNKLIDEDNRNE